MTAILADRHERFVKDPQAFLGLLPRGIRVDRFAAQSMRIRDMRIRGNPVSMLLGKKHRDPNRHCADTAALPKVDEISPQRLGLGGIREMQPYRLLRRRTAARYRCSR
ncbi:hypothetical protein Rcae01_04307 [Novipirellula caenicola]|uniref:Uncharacterized protein n=1 Tax=Novipirellula caenicola TaxID=1536901 RepID=A0ABP9VZ13_9BACT